ARSRNDGDVHTGPRDLQVATVVHGATPDGERARSCRCPGVSPRGDFGPPPGPPLPGRPVVDRDLYSGHESTAKIRGAPRDRGTSLNGKSRARRRLLDDGGRG